MPSRRTNNFPESWRGLGHVTPTIFGIWSNMSLKLLELETSNLIHGLYGQCRAGAQINFPESGRGLGHVTPQFLAVRSAVLATAWLLVVAASSNLIVYMICLSLAVFCCWCAEVGRDGETSSFADGKTPVPIWEPHLCVMHFNTKRLLHFRTEKVNMAKTLHD